MVNEAKKEGNLNIIIIGLGHHARRIYFPVIKELSSKTGVKVVGIVDLESQRKNITEYLTKNNKRIPTLFMKGELDTKDLDIFSKNLKIHAVVISTDPESHVFYAKWALSKGIHVLMDKPIHAERNASNDAVVARIIHKKYSELAEVFIKSRKKYPLLVCEVMTQRRHHPAYQLIKQTVEDVYKKVGCPISYMYSYHNDGQWRLPDELHEVEYHGFNKGYGKASHSGYHFYDLLSWFSQSYREDYGINTVNCDAWANYPSNYLRQVNQKTLKRVFNDLPAQKYKYSDFDNYGEIDVLSRIQLKNDDVVITNAEIDLQHSGLTARNWKEIGSRDIYKGNGRIRQEQHFINMGPFLSISMTSWQGIEFHKESIKDGSLYDPGHEFNLDINIFKNSKLTGGKTLESYSLKDFYSPSLQDYSRGHQEDARKQGVINFIQTIKSRSPDSSSSSLLSHALTSKIMSIVYESLALKKPVSGNIN